MPHVVSHIAVNADDVDRARGFYESVFGWRLEPWGPPGFLKIYSGTGSDAVHIGAIQQRRELLPGVRTNAFESTIAVDDIEAVAEAVQANGGTILMEKAVIPGVGELIFFADSEGNIAGAMRYEAAGD